MKYCSNCGEQIDDKAVICPKCGVSQAAMVNVNDDSGSFGWAVLGYCIPIVGLILFLVWKDTKPQSAKMAGVGAFIAVACVVLFYVLIVLGGVSFFRLVNVLF